MLEGLSRLRQGHTRRYSSWDQRGGNADYWRIPAGQTVTLAGIEGAGIIRHIWFTVSSPDTLYLRKTVLRMFWDGQAYPSVETPLGDFFGVGHARVASYACAPFSMSANKGDEQHAAMNCYFPMPFGRGARIEVTNESDQDIRSFYFMMR